jgi:hypothetical protein
VAGLLGQLKGMEGSNGSYIVRPHAPAKEQIRRRLWPSRTLGTAERRLAFLTTAPSVFDAIMFDSRIRIPGIS